MLMRLAGQYIDNISYIFCTERKAAKTLSMTHLSMIYKQNASEVNYKFLFEK